MEEISVNGENYVKASSLARELGYTSDYVGQLCRGKQVASKLIGRTWYVNEASLRAHKEGRYRSTAQKSRNEVRKAVTIMNSAESGPNYLRRLNLASSYETDEAPLYPSLQKSSGPEMASEIKPYRIKIDRHSAPRQTLKPDTSEVRNNNVENGNSIAAAGRVTVISARSNQLDGKGRVKISASVAGRTASSFKFKLTLAFLAIVAGVLLFANFSLESRVLATEEGSNEAVNFNVSFVKEALLKAFK